jgi:hypothetical protein
MSFVKLSMGNRHRVYLRMTQDNPKFGPGYTSVELGYSHLIDSTGKIAPKKHVVQAGEVVQIVLNDNINPSRCTAFVCPNPTLFASGWLSYVPLIGEGEDGFPVITFKADRKVDLAELSYIVRISVME